MIARLLYHLTSKLPLLVLYGSAGSACIKVPEFQGTDAVPDAGCTTGAHDEDGDCVADDVDPCPHVPMERSGDEDGDGIFDGCDRFFGTPSTLDVWSFAEEGTADRWQALANTAWTWDGESLVFQRLDASSVYSLLDRGPLQYTGSRVIVETQLVIDELGPRANLSLRIDADATGAFAFACSLIDSEPPSVSTVEAYEFNRPAPTSASLPQLEAGDRVHVVLDFEASRSPQLRCTANLAGGGGNAVMWTAAETHPAGALGLAGYGMRARVEWLAFSEPQ